MYTGSISVLNSDPKTENQNVYHIITIMYISKQYWVVDGLNALHNKLSRTDYSAALFQVEIQHAFIF